MDTTWASKIFPTILVTTMLAGPLSVPGFAETDADFSKFCRTEFPNSGPVTRAPSGSIAHYCNQRGTLQGIDLARACELTTGNRKYRKVGDRVLCEDGPGASQTASGEPLNAADLVRYCRTKFPNSIYQDIPGNFGGNHHCRRPGGSTGFTLQPVNIADACVLLGKGETYRKDGERIICIPAETRPTAKRRATGTGNTARNQQSPDVPRPSPPGGAGNEASDETRQTELSENVKTVKDSVSGDWQMTSNGLRNGLKVRLEVRDNQVTGYIVKYPPQLAEVARSMDGLKTGRPFMFGKLTGKTVTGKTRIGIMAASQTMNQSGNVHCRSFVANLETNRENWMPLRIELTGDTFKGRHKIVGIKGDCTLFPLPDLPPRMKGGYAVFEMSRIVETCGPKNNTDVFVPKYRALVVRHRAGSANQMQSPGAKQ